MPATPEPLSSRLLLSPPAPVPLPPRGPAGNRVEMACRVDLGPQGVPDPPGGPDPPG